MTNIVIPKKWVCNETAEIRPKKVVCHCKKDSLTIIQGYSEDLDNKSAYIDFLMAFKHYHFETFFDYIFLDKKVKRLYRDSVVIDTILVYQNNMSLVMPCYGCNVVAQITFRNQKYLVPHLLNGQLMNFFEDYNQSFYMKSFQYQTIFSKKDNNKSTFIQNFDIKNFLITEIYWNQKFHDSKTIQNLRFNTE